MITTFRREELIRELLTRRGYQPLRTDVEVDIATGSDIIAHLSRELDDIVARLFIDAPPEKLPRSSAVIATRGVEESLVDPPATALRILSVAAPGWAHAVEPVDASHPSAAALANPFLRRGTLEPLAVRRPDGAIALHPRAAEATLSFIPAPKPGAEEITFDASLLAHPLFNTNPYDDNL